MLEKTIIDYLGEELKIPCYGEEPESDLTEYIVIEKTSGSRKNFLDSATIAVQSYGGSLYEAAELNIKVKKAMEDIVKLQVIAGCHLNSDYNFTNPQKKQYRYQAVFDIKYYER